VITKNDIPGLRKLWQQAFGDSEDFLDKFFRAGFSFDRCRCIREEGKIAAALYWFDCTWKDKKVAYIYAVATDEALRGRGLCRRLMEDTHRQLRQSGYSGAVLVPGDEGLCTMYAKFGYQAFCPVKQATADASKVTTAHEISSVQYRVLRQDVLGENAVLQGDTALAFLATYGGFYKSEKALFCGYREGDTFRFEEILGAVSSLQTEFLQAMYLSLDGDLQLPDYFAIPLI